MMKATASPILQLIRRTVVAASPNGDAFVAWTEFNDTGKSVAFLRVSASRQ